MERNSGGNPNLAYAIRLVLAVRYRSTSILISALTIASRAFTARRWLPLAHPPGARPAE
jgi:hypothetical protein